MAPTDWTPRGTPQVNFRAGEMLPDLEARTARSSGGLAVTASRDLERYYYHLKMALASVTLTTDQAQLIVDVMNGTITEPHTASLLWASVSDALDDGLAEKWDVDGLNLVNMLRHLPPFTALAIADACERFWNRVAAGREETNEERLRAVGLLR